MKRSDILKMMADEATLSGCQSAPPVFQNMGPVFSGKHLAENDIHKQLIHMRSELVEVGKEMYGPAKLNAEDLAREVIDAQNSCETMLKIITRDFGVDIQKAREWVFNKNVARHYNPGSVDPGHIVGPINQFAASDKDMNDMVGRALEEMGKEQAMINDLLKVRKHMIDPKEFEAEYKRVTGKFPLPCFTEENQEYLKKLEKELEYKLNYDRYRSREIEKPVQKYKHPIPEYGKPLPGISPDAPVVKNTAGGSQSESIYDFTDVNPLALLRIAARSAYGQKKYGRNNWDKITSSEHFNHGMIHMIAYMVGDRSDDHLGAMGWRILAGIAVAMKEESEKG